MYRYFILVWNAADADETQAARSVRAVLAGDTRWSLIDAGEGAVAFHSGANRGAGDAAVLADGSGVVLGTVFDRSIGESLPLRRRAFAAAQTRLIEKSHGRHLIEAFWGRYVALIRSVTGGVSVLRDPSGGLPCLLARYRGVYLFFSDLADCQALGLLRFTVNWRYIRRFVALVSLQSRETALEEVSEVQPGELCRISRGTLERSLEWRPLEVARDQPLENPRQAIEQLRATTRMCVHAWAACYPDLIHNLSGGLDSSIVLSCLIDAPSRPRITCLHYHGDGPEEDEREFARLMAQQSDVELIEHRLDVDEARLQRLMQLQPSARPWFYMYEIEHGEFERQLAVQRGAGALFSGGGGDGVFFQGNGELAAADFLIARGFRRGLWSAAVDSARVSRKSVWAVLLGAMRARLQRRPDLRALAGVPSSALLNPSLARSVDGFEHPSFTPAATRGTPPGLLQHAVSSCAVPAFYSSFPGGPHPERVMPLLSQPLVELCLRIPTYVLIDGGIDRALARRAFAADVPPRIVRRTGKGRVDQHLRNILDNNLDFVRDLLLDGRLVQEGLLDRERLLIYLDRRRSPADFHYTDILHHHVCTEAWLASWLGRAEGTHNMPAATIAVTPAIYSSAEAARS